MTAGPDITDFEPLNLRSRRPRKAMPPSLLHVSDDETREKILSAWQNDREKKKERKLQREERRRQGLLGWSAEQIEFTPSHDGQIESTPSDGIRHVGKYAQGLKHKDLVRELDIFCKGPDEMQVITLDFGTFH